MRKVLCILTICLFIIGCSPRYGQYLSSPRNHPYGSFMQLEEDSTFIYQSWFEWVERNSFGAWSTIPSKKNHILLKSCLSDYTHVPMEVVESQNEEEKTIIILKQGAKFYDCEYNEMHINGKSIKIDRDTLFLPQCHVDSISIHLGYSEQLRKQLWGFSPEYNSVCTQTYVPIDSSNNVFTILLPEFPHRKINKLISRGASMLFLYIPINEEFFFKNGKWYQYGYKGALISYKRKKLNRTEFEGK